MEHAVMLEKKRELELETLASTKRSLQRLHESEQVGTSTAVELYRQGEVLKNTEGMVDEINASLQDSKRHIRGIKSVGGAILNHFKGPNKNRLQSANLEESQGKNAISQGVESNRGQNRASEAMRQRINHTDDFDDLLDKNLDDISAGLGRLKGLALGMQNELENQDPLIDRLNRKIEHANIEMGKQGKDMDKILKR